MLALAMSLAIVALPSRYTGGVWNPEDMVRLPASSRIVVTAMQDKTRPGALRLVDLARAARGLAIPAVDAATFSYRLVSRMLD